MSAAVVEPVARWGGMVGRGLRDVTSDLAALDSTGRWAVVLPFSGAPVLARFDMWRHDSASSVAGPWRGPSTDAWISSMSESEYCRGVETVRERIAAGGVYQANVCRVMTARMSGSDDIGGLHAALDARHPAPYGGMVRLPAQGVHVASASPELFLRREGDVVVSGPIKGTGRQAADLGGKDRAENVMIVDLVRNDLSRVSRVGGVSVPHLLREEAHPGLVHLVSDVQGELLPGTSWADLLAATFPPGSVTGAPKLAALEVIDEVEPVERGVYCGAVGWVDADERRASLAVAIRTFWRDGDRLLFGTGAGITWGSDPQAEWAETCLKAERLIDVAAGTWPG